MQHIIIGYGYCGYFLAKLLLEQNQTVVGISRNYSEPYVLTGLNHLPLDVLKEPLLLEEPYIIYYLIPPQSESEQDIQLKTFLSLNNLNPTKAVYFGSSGVYGDHGGQLVDEHSPCHIRYSRQSRRLDAEQQWQKAFESTIILRTAGIYGPARLPIQAVKAGQPLIEAQSAPLTNLIDVRDLAWIACHLAMHPTAEGIFNVSDGHPRPMGTLQKLIQEALSLPKAPQESLHEALASASAMKKEFLLSSKSLNNTKLKRYLKAFAPRPLEQNIIELLNQQEDYFHD